MLVPLADTMIVAVPTVPAVTEADALVCPTGTVTVAGTPATAGALLLNATVYANIAGALKLTVSVPVLPTQSVCLDSVTPDNVTGEGTGGGGGVEDTVTTGAGFGCGATMSVNTAVQPRSAVMVTVPVAHIPPPDQPSNVDPAAGVASSVTTVPFG